MTHHSRRHKLSSNCFILLWVERVESGAKGHLEESDMDVSIKKFRLTCHTSYCSTNHSCEKLQTETMKPTKETEEAFLFLYPLPLVFWLFQKRKMSIW